uniref:F-box domain-containing protein n=1 Tax=Lactuca sativa TaxID=4236 RepID=A0A9R1XC76_LACSA|nr:hypothetical protein LSAT_V11C500243030 [Lactuca sativa]
MLNIRSCHSLDDLPLELLSRIFVVLGSKSAKDIVSARFCSMKMYEAGGDPQVYRTTCIDMFAGMGPKNLKADLFIRTCALHNNIEPMFRQGIIKDRIVHCLDIMQTFIWNQLSSIWFLDLRFI